MLTRSIYIRSLLLLILVTSFTSSCQSNKKGIRLVDMRGKHRNVKTSVPEQNIALLSAQQGQIYVAEQRQIAANSPSSPPQINTNVTGNKYTSIQPADSSVQNTVIISKPVSNTKSNVKFSAGAEQKKKARTTKRQSVDTHSKQLSTKASKGIFIQTGTFSSHLNAKTMSDRTKNASSMNNIRIVEKTVSGKKLYRVLTGPFSTRSSAELVVKKLDSSGIQSMIIVEQ